jgi:cold shock CspA family protein
MIGVVTKIMPPGFGFLQPDHDGKDIFFHQRDFERAGLAPARVGDRVRFDICETSKGPKVSGNLSRIDDDAAE